jgi:hypothetical protein
MIGAWPRRVNAWSRGDVPVASSMAGVSSHHHEATVEGTIPIVSRQFQHENDYARMRNFDGPLPAPALPAGYRLRHVSGAEKAEARVAVHCTAFTQSTMTAEKYRQMVEPPGYRPGMDFVAVAPDGSFAAFTIVWWDAIN